MSPAVSVVMSVYNDAARLPQAVESILAQTFTDFEFIMIDDGSTDGTSDLLDRLAQSDARIRVIHQENTGLTRALIQGCQESFGKYVARQDSDDWSHPARLAKQVSVLESVARIGFVSCWTQYVGPGDEPLEVLRRPAEARLATQQLLHERQGPPAHGSVIFRKSLYDAVGGYHKEFYFGQDSDLWLRMAERDWIAYVPECLYTARREAKSVSGALSGLQRQFGELGQACHRARQAGLSDQPYLHEAAALTQQVAEDRRAGRLFQGIGIEMAYLIGSQLTRNRDARATRYFWQVLRQRPWHWRAWIRMAQSLFTARGGPTDHQL